ncbi:proteinase-activated receptor 1-like [Dendropsophus ebraccatus]|uniref:proteinase-activated receptor 1-like n=1 Tax=Dendropsophus ebraccatus TaxID=150705 RepID=UPI003831D85E
MGRQIVGPFRIPEGVKINSIMYVEFFKQHFLPWFKKKNPDFVFKAMKQGEGQIQKTELTACCFDPKSLQFCDEVIDHAGLTGSQLVGNATIAFAKQNYLVNELLGYAARLGILITIVLITYLDGKPSIVPASNSSNVSYAINNISYTMDESKGQSLLDIWNRYTATLSDNVLSHLSSHWLTICVPLMFIFVFLIALPLNIIAIIMFLVRIKVKKPAVVYMLNLALADVLFVCTLPFNIVYRFFENNWLMGEGMCRFTIAAFYCNMYCSILIMTTMSVDKFLALVYPIQSLYWRKVSRSWFICCIIWLISICSTIPLLIYQQTQYFIVIERTTCHDVQNKVDANYLYRYYFGTFCILFFFLPFIVTSYCYFVIIKSLSSSQMGDIESKRQAVILVIIVLCSFVLCFGPTNVIFFIQSLRIGSKSANDLYFVYLICISVCSISCCLDPLLYYFTSTQNYSFLSRLLCCKKNTKGLTQNTQNTSQTEASD